MQATMIRFRRRLLWFTALCAVAAIGLMPPRALASRLALTEFSLPVVSPDVDVLQPDQFPRLTSGPDGNVWFTRLGVIHRITPDGVVTDFPLATGTPAHDIVAGPDGNLWFEAGLTVGRMTPSGVITQFNLGQTVVAFPPLLTAGGDGNVWFASAAPSSSIEFYGAAVARITPGGQTTVFPIPSCSSVRCGLSGMTAGSDGNVWFTIGPSLVIGPKPATAGKIGRVTPAGDVTEFPLPSTMNTPQSIARGPDGAIWFTYGFMNGCSISCGIARITEDGTVTDYPTPGQEPRGIVAGPDGNLWFTTVVISTDSTLPPLWRDRGALGIGRLTPAGVITLFQVGDRSQVPASLIVSPSFYQQVTDTIIRGPDDNVWFVKYSGWKAALVSLAIAKFAPPTPPRPSTIAVFRSSTGEWFVPDGGARLWGVPGDTPVPGDYDGDGVADLAVYRPSTGEWLIRRSSTGTLTQVGFGMPGDQPVPADYDGDGKTDVAVYRPAIGEWLVQRSSDGALLRFVWGAQQDVPVPADYDGDGLADVAVYRPATGEWLIRRSFDGGSTVAPWGAPGDVPVPGDYDGNGLADLAVYRPSTGEWFIRYAVTKSFAQLAFGSPGDEPVPADYDGDGQTDLAVYRPSTGEWFVRRSSDGAVLRSVWGVHQDLPVPAGY